jgi:hypothetical protein
VWPLGRGRISRIEGVLLIVAYVGYMVLLFAQS